MSKLFKPRKVKKALKQIRSTYKMDISVSKRLAPTGRLFPPGFGMVTLALKAADNFSQ